MTTIEERRAMGFPNRISLLIAGSILALGSHPAAAQTTAPAANNLFCIVFASEELEGQLMAACAGKAFVLGPAETYEVFENSGLPATIIDLTWSGKRRVLMISAHDDHPLLEDISGTLSKSAGRGPMSGLDDVTIDFSSFAQTGIVQTASAEAVGVTGEVNVGPQIAAEAIRSGLAQD